MQANFQIHLEYTYLTINHNLKSRTADLREKNLGKYIN